MSKTQNGTAAGLQPVAVPFYIIPQSRRTA